MVDVPQDIVDFHRKKGTASIGWQQVWLCAAAACSQPLSETIDNCELWNIEYGKIERSFPKFGFRGKDRNVNIVKCK